MANDFNAKVVTANTLLEGIVVYLAADDRWLPDMTEAEVLDDEAHATLRLLQAQARTKEVVGVYLADVKVGPNGPEPVHFREDFRRLGPSNRFHGKQADRLTHA